ncbi:leucine-rich repeat protein [Candidatus Methanarcanum hacksteinii]|uniref:leucine-rich repeat protein n=1 Tax=Candidatus Methanarcanum hacksteinii TaxID=2911857 RepID=UPI0037DCE62C
MDGDQAIIKVDVDGYTYELNGKEATLISLGTEKKTDNIYNIPAKISYDGEEYSVVAIGKENNGSSGIKEDRLGNVIAANRTHENIIENFSGIIQGEYSIKLNSDVRINSYAFYTEVDKTSGHGLSYGAGDSGLTKIDTNGHKITSIGDYAFAKCVKLTEISWAEDCSFIGKYAFSYCGDNDGGISSASVNCNILDGTFYRCNKLSSVMLGNNVKEIGRLAFSQTNLSEIKINSEIGKIGESAFSRTKLESITISGISEFGKNAFNSSQKLKQVTLSGSFDKIPDGMFSACSSLENVVLSDSCNKIGVLSFKETTNLKSFNFTNYIEIGDNAFNGSGLEQLSMPSTVTNVGINAFSPCPSLKTVSINSDVLSSKSIFEGCGELSEITINGVTTIGPNVFKDCTSLTAINLDGVVNIGASTFSGAGLVTVNMPSTVTNVGINAFSPCPSLKTVSINSNVLSSKSIFEGCGELSEITINGVTTIGPNVFKDCTLLNNVDLTNVISIGESAFDSSGLKDVIIPATTTSIGKKAFFGCTSLTNVIFNNTVDTLPESIFEGCSVLKSIKMPNGLKNLSQKSFKGTVALDVNDVIWDATIEDVLGWPTNVFEGSGVVKLDPAKEGSELGYRFIKLKLVDKDSFNTVSILASITDKLDTLGYDYTYNLPSDLIAIYDYGGKWSKVSISSNNAKYQTYLGVLYSGDGKTLLKAPYCYDAEDTLETLTTIGSRSFSGTNLQTIYIPEGVTDIEEYAFANCNTLQSVVMPEGLKKIGHFAFNKTQINRMVLPASVESIGKYAFAYDKNSDIKSMVVEVPFDSKLSYVGDGAMSAEGPIFIPAGLKTDRRIDVPLFGKNISDVYLGGYYDKNNMDKFFKNCKNLKFYLPLGEEKTINSTNGELAGYYVIMDGVLSICDTKLSANGRDVYFVSSVGKITPQWSVEGQSFTLTSEIGYSACDLVLTYGNGSVITANGEIYTLPDAKIIHVDERTFTITHKVSFDTNGGEKINSLIIGDGRSILTSSLTVPYKDMSEHIGWYSDKECKQHYTFSTPVTKDIVLYAGWASRAPMLYLDPGIGTITAKVGDVVSTTDVLVQNGSSASLVFTVVEGCEFIGWEIRSGDSTIAKNDPTLTINAFEHDTFVRAVYRYFSLSSRLTQINNVPTPDLNEEYSVIWKTDNVLDNSNMVWTGHSSVPLIVGDYIYARAGTSIYKYDSEDGSIIARCDSKNVSQFYHYLGYANGMIFDFATGDAFDLDLKPIAYTKPQGNMINVFYDDGQIYIYHENEGKGYISSYTSELKSKQYDKELQYTLFTQYGGGGNGCVVSDGHLWFVAAPGEQRIIVSIKLSDGTLSDSIDLSTIDLGNSKTIAGYYMDDGWLSCYDSKLYLTCYTRGLFDSTVGDGTKGYVFTVPTSEGKFVKDSVTFTETGSMANSEFVVYKNRGYVNVGGQLRVYNMSDMSVIYTAASSYTHGGIMIDTSGASESNNWEVKIFLIPYSPTGELYVFKDTQIQQSAQLTVKKINVLKAFNSQCVRLTESGKLVWYNDSGQLFCVGLTKDIKHKFFIDYGDKGVWYQASGRYASDAFINALKEAGIEYTIENSTITSLDGCSNGNGAYWNTYKINKDYEQFDLMSAEDLDCRSYLIVYGNKDVQGANINTKKQWLYLDDSKDVKVFSLGLKVPVDAIGKIMVPIDILDTSTTISGNSVSSVIMIKNDLNIDSKVKIFVKFSDNSFMQFKTNVKMNEGVAYVEFVMNGNATPSEMLISVTDHDGNQLKEYSVDLTTV